MTVPADPYNFVNGTPADGDQVDARFAPLYAALNGALDVDNLAASLKTLLGLSDGTSVRAGKSIVATEEARTSTSYGLLTTPDRVQSVELPTDGLIFVLYEALWKRAGANVKAAVFLGSNQVKVQGETAHAPAIAETVATSADSVYGPLVSTPGGLDGSQANASGFSSDVTTGQIVGSIDSTSGFVGGAMAIFAAAGTYDVSVQFKVLSAGTVTAKERKLWVWTRGF